MIEMLIFISAILVSFQAKTQDPCVGIFIEGIIFMSSYCRRETEYVKVKN